MHRQGTEASTKVRGLNWNCWVGGVSDGEEFLVFLYLLSAFVTLPQQESIICVSFLLQIQNIR